MFKLKLIMRSEFIIGIILIMLMAYSSGYGLAEDGNEDESGITTWIDPDWRTPGVFTDWDSVNVEEGSISKMLRQIEEVKKGSNTGVGPSISMTSNFKFPRAMGPVDPSSPQYFYSRFNNPNYEQLERQISVLYDTRHLQMAAIPNDLVTPIGTLEDLLDDHPTKSPTVLSFSSGMGAISAVLWSLMGDGDRIVMGNELYNEIKDIGVLMGQYADIKMISVDLSDIDAVVDAASDPAVRVLYMESASNPHSRIPDFDNLIPKVRSVNPDIVVVVDNTWLTPALFQPFSHDVDVIVESATKYLSGKADALSGIAAVYHHPKPLKSNRKAEPVSVHFRNIPTLIFREILRRPVSGPHH